MIGLGLWVKAMVRFSVWVGVTFFIAAYHKLDSTYIAVNYFRM